MSVWSGIRARLRALFRRTEADRELDEELRFHLDMETEKYLREGLSPALARRRARLALGSRERYREEHRDVRGMRWAEWLVQDAAYAARGLWHNGGFTLVALLTLGLGMGANTAAFGVVDALLYREPSGAGEPEALFRVRLSQAPVAGGGQAEYRPVWTSYPEYRDLSERSEGMLALAAYRQRTVIYGRGEAAREITAVTATRNYWGTLGVRPALGRFPAEPGEHGDDAVAVLGYDFWQREFGGDRDVLGREIVVSSNAVVVIGVAPRHFRGIDLDPIDVYLPIELETRFSLPEILDSRNAYWLWLVGRREAGITADAASARLTALLRALHEEYPKTTAAATVDLLPVSERFAIYGRTSPVPLWLLGVTAAVLLIACGNVSNLLLARGAGRRREFAIRSAIGASRGRIVLQVLTESILLALAGGVASLGFALSTARLLHLLDIPRLDPLIDVRVLAFAFVIALVTSVLVGLLPALRASRSDVEAELKSATPRATYDRSRVRAVLTMVQVALSVVLLVNAGLFIRSLHNVMAINADVDVDRLLVASLRIQRGTPPGQVLAMKKAGLERLRTLPDVESAELSSGAPFFAGLGLMTLDPAMAGLPEGTQLSAVPLTVGPEYFRTVGLHLRAGRLIEPTDRSGTPPIIVVNATMARLFGGERGVLGRCLPLIRDGCVEVAGVVSDSKFIEPIEASRPAIYYPVAQRDLTYLANSLVLLVRTKDASAATMATIRRELLATASRSSSPGDARDTAGPATPANVQYANVQYIDVQSIGELLRPKLQPWRVATVIFTFFGVIAFVLAGIGLYGVVAYLVAARRPEMGIRIALGAAPGRILSLVLGEGVRLVAIGGVAGFALAFGVSRLLESRMYGVRPVDALTWGGVAMLLGGVAVGASFVSAVRATRVDPNIALRAD
jgi:putative ABC transport system permease protein